MDVDKIRMKKWLYVRKPGPGQERQCSPSTKLITACVVSAQKVVLKKVQEHNKLRSELLESINKLR